MINCDNCKEPIEDAEFCFCDICNGKICVDCEAKDKLFDTEWVVCIECREGILQVCERARESDDTFFRAFYDDNNKI